jgi:hypothetical protein
MWAAGLVLAALISFAFLTYRRPLVPLTVAQRAILGSLRATALASIVVFLMRPVALMPPGGDGDTIVPVLVDTSRSMRLADAEGAPRLQHAVDVVKDQLLPALGARFRIEVYGVGESISPGSLDELDADDRQSDLAGAIAAIRERYQGRQLAAIVLLSDGGDTTGNAPPPSIGSAPVFAIGVGSPDSLRDRELVGIAAADPQLDDAAVDLHVTAVSHRYGRSPFQVRLLANGQLVETRTVTPTADGAPSGAAFTVTPDTVSATVYTAEIAPESDEAAVENNTRSVVLNPAGRKRRVLVLQGAPGYEHSFLTRALARDPMLDVDVVVRKGRDENGDHTYFIQASAGRSALLTGGLPATREALYAYDALIVANVEGDFFPRARLDQMAEFVSDRGGGLLVLGARSFAQRGLLGTPLEAVLPVELNDRRGGLTRAMFEQAPRQQNAILLTAAGETHPVMRLGKSPAETREMWSALPALASGVPLGGPKPGATLLAAMVAPGGALHPVVAVQRYGRGRSMVFAGEGAWRWRMMMPAGNRTYEIFWRQAARWLAGPSPDPLTVTIPDAGEPGDSLEIIVDARDRAFAPASDALVEASVTPPGADTQPLTLRRDSTTPGRFVGMLQPAASGLYRVRAAGKNRTSSLGAADRWLYVGGNDREFSDPRLNEGFLRRLARASGGDYARADSVADLIPALQASSPQGVAPERRDLWNTPAALAFVVLLLSAEWTLRRHWGLR